MNKLHILGLMTFALVGFTACEPDEDPKMTVPSTFELDTPSYADQAYQLTPGGTMQFTCQKPDYSVALAPSYSLDFSLTDQFNTAADGTPEYYSIISGSNPEMSIKESELAEIVCRLNGVTNFLSYPEDGIPAAPLYVRSVATLPTVGPCYSNVIRLSSVTTYNPFPEGGRVIYMVGDATAWNAGDPTSPYVLTETAPESNVYVGVFNFSAGSKYFRFYKYMTAEAGWGNDGELPSIGSNPKDGQNAEVVVTDEPLVVKAVPGKGNWYTSSTWEGGDITFTVDLRRFNEKDPSDPDSFMTVSMVKGSYDFTTLPCLYVVGQFSAWTVSEPTASKDYENYRVFDYNKDGIYYGTFYVPAGSAFFRFFSELGDWGKGSIGAAASGDNADFSFTNGVFSGDTYSSGCNWRFNDWTSGYMKMVVDTKTNKVNFSSVDITNSGEVINK